MLGKQKQINVSDQLDQSTICKPWKNNQICQDDDECCKPTSPMGKMILEEGWGQNSSIIDEIINEVKRLAAAVDNNYYPGPSSFNTAYKDRILEVKIVEGLEESVRTQSWIQGISKGMEQLCKINQENSRKQVINNNEFYPTINMPQLQQPQIQILNPQPTVINNLPQFTTNIYNNQQSPQIINNINPQIKNNWTINPEINNNNEFKPQIINNFQPENINHFKTQNINNFKPQNINNFNPQITNNFQPQMTNNFKPEITNEFKPQLINKIQVNNPPIPVIINLQPLNQILNILTKKVFKKELKLVKTYNLWYGGKIQKLQISNCININIKNNEESTQKIIKKQAFAQTNWKYKEKIQHPKIVFKPKIYLPQMKNYISNQPVIKIPSYQQKVIVKNRNIIQNPAAPNVIVNNKLQTQHFRQKYNFNHTKAVKKMNYKQKKQTIKQNPKSHNLKKNKIKYIQRTIKYKEKQQQVIKYVEKRVIKYVEKKAEQKQKITIVPTINLQIKPQNIKQNKQKQNNTDKLSKSQKQNIIKQIQDINKRIALNKGIVQDKTALQQIKQDILKGHINREGARALIDCMMSLQHDDYFGQIEQDYEYEEASDDQLCDSDEMQQQQEGY